MWRLSTISVIEPGKDAKNANNCACGDRSFAVLAITQGTAYLFEGGNFVWPGVKTGHTRVVSGGYPWGAFRKFS